MITVSVQESHGHHKGDSTSITSDEPSGYATAHKIEEREWHQGDTHQGSAMKGKKQVRDQENFTDSSQDTDTEMKARSKHKQISEKGVMSQKMLIKGMEDI